VRGAWCIGRWTLDAGQMTTYMHVSSQLSTYARGHESLIYLHARACVSVLPKSTMFVTGCYQKRPKTEGKYEKYRFLANGYPKGDSY
jgi:hypothetical protein